MTTTPATHSAAERFDTSQRYAHDRHLPPGTPTPHPTSAWPQENVALLELFLAWLRSSGTSPNVIDQLLIPMAGNALGLNLKPHPLLDIDSDLERALDYVKAKQLSPIRTRLYRNALDKFRRFLSQQRGCPDVALKPISHQRYSAGLPLWLVDQLQRLQRLRQVNWRPARVDEQIRRFWGTHTRLWHWLFQHYAITTLSDVTRQQIFDYIDHRLEAGYAASSINQDLRAFHALLIHLQDQGHSIPLALLNIRGLKQPDRLPRFLTDEQVTLVRDDIEGRLALARTPGQWRDALLDRATFYLLWHAGLRLGELEELRLQDLDLDALRLTVRQGKGRKDRLVYLTDTAVRALRLYLTVRGMGPTDHLFLYRNRPLLKDLVHARIKAAGDRTGVKVSPHRLRHTYATQLLNAGCPITSIQRLLGHRQLSSTLIYARVHDRTIAQDYHDAMGQIESRLTLLSTTDPASQSTDSPSNTHILSLLEQLAAPRLSPQVRLDLVEQIRCALCNQNEPLSLSLADQPRVPLSTDLISSP
jgi:site-specific recombinase XerD